MLLELGFVFFFSFTSLFMLRKVARVIGLVDKPDARKKHKGAIPLVGGVAVFITLAQFVYSNPTILPDSNVFLIVMFFLITVGLIDDKFDISYRFRLLVQASLTLIMIHYAGIEVVSFGNVFGSGEFVIDSLSTFVTILGVLAVINAFNMVDGIDGLLGGLSIVTFASLSVVLQMHGQGAMAYFCIVIVAAILPYVLMNLGFLGRQRRVFMGDAGSMMIGFTVIWIMLSISQHEVSKVMRPVTALWLMALPLMDMTTIVYRRLRAGRSPFKPDRDHLHHICERIGLSNTQTLAFICGLASVFALIGILGEFFLINEALMLGGFVMLSTLYAWLILKNWPKKIVDKINSSKIAVK